MGEVAEGVVVGDQLAPGARAPRRCSRRCRGRAAAGRPGRRRRCVRSGSRCDGSAAARRALDLAAPRPRRCAGRATSAGRTATPRRRSSRRAGGSGPRRRGRRLRRRCRCRRRPRSIQASRLSPLAKTSFAPAARLDVARPRLVLVRVGVGLQDLVDRDRVAADLAHPVADLGRRRDDVELAEPGRRTRRRSRASSRSASGAERRGSDSRRAGACRNARTAATSDEDAAGDAGDRRPRRGVGLDREPEPDACPRRRPGRRSPAASAAAARSRGGR